MHSSLAAESESSYPATENRNAPRVSLVIASSGASQEFAHSVDLIAARADARCEVVVVRPEPICADIRRSLSRIGAKIVEAAPHTPDHELRALGANTALGDVVLLRERVVGADVSLVSRLLSVAAKAGDTRVSR